MWGKTVTPLCLLHVWVPWNLPDHHSTTLFRCFAGILIWPSIVPRDASFLDSGCTFLSRFATGLMNTLYVTWLSAWIIQRDAFKLAIAIQINCHIFNKIFPEENYIFRNLIFFSHSLKKATRSKVVIAIHGNNCTLFSKILSEK